MSSLWIALSRQRIALLEKRRLLDRALQAINEVESAMEDGRSTAGLLRRIIEVIEMQNDSNWMMKYYSPEAQAKISERAKSFTLEDQKAVLQAWKDYYRELATMKGQKDSGGGEAADSPRAIGNCWPNSPSTIRTLRLDCVPCTGTGLAGRST